MSLKIPSIALILLHSALLLSLNTSALISKPELKFFNIPGRVHNNIDKEIPLNSDQVQTKPTLSLNQTFSPVYMTLKSAPPDKVAIKNQHLPSSQLDRPARPYTIKKGDTPSSVAEQHDIPLKELLNTNQGIESRKLQVGHILNLPAKSLTAKIKIEARLGKKMINSTEIAAADSSSAPQKRVVYSKERPGGTNPIISNSQLAAGKKNVSSRFGKRSDPVSSRQKFHKGVDISRPIGTEVITWSDGVVAQAGWRHDYGLTVDVVHPNGIKTRYAHLKSANVQKGQRLDEGQVIGQVGNTGRTTGANLHFEVMVAGKLTDPQNYLTEDLQIVGNQTTMNKNG